MTTPATTPAASPAASTSPTARRAVILMAYGTPRSLDEVEEYYTDIRRGRPPTPEQLADLIRRYEAIGGCSPLRARSEAQRAALAAALDAPDTRPGRGSEPSTVHLGYLHTAPRIADAVAAARAGGATELVGLVLAPHDSAGSVGKYAARLAEAAATGSPPIPQCCVRSWATLPAFIGFLAAQIGESLRALPDGSRVVFTAHSLPQRLIDEGDRYVDEVTATATAVATRIGLAPARWQVAWQSAGRTPEPWLGPDVLEVIDALAAEGCPGVLVCAVGFVADHLEVLYDLDLEAAQRAAQRGIAFARTACVNDDRAVFAELAEMIEMSAPQDPITGAPGTGQP